MPIFDTPWGPIDAPNQGRANVIGLERAEAQQRQRAAEEAEAVRAARTAAPPSADPSTDIGALASLTGRVEAIEASLPELNQELPDRARLEELAVAIHRSANAREEFTAVVDQQIRRVQAVGDQADQQLASLSQRQALQEQAVAEAISRSDDTATANRQATTDLVEELRRRAATGEWQGPQGERGMRGLAAPGCTLTDVSPLDVDRQSFARRFYGRNSLLPGDSCLEISPSRNAVIAWRYASNGAGWEQGVELQPKVELVSQRFGANIEAINISHISGGGQQQDKPSGALVPLINTVGAGAGVRVVFKIEDADLPQDAVAAKGFTFSLLFEDGATDSMRMTATITPSIAAGQYNIADYDVVTEGAGATWTPTFSLRSIGTGGLQLEMLSGMGAGVRVSGWAVPLLVKR